MHPVRTPRAGTIVRAPVPELPWLHQIVLPTPWAVGPVQIYLVDSEPLTLVDTGVRSQESREALGQALEQLGYGFEDIERVVVTHAHGDHLGQAETVRRASSGLEVCAHRDEVEAIEEFSVTRDERVDDTHALFREHGVDPLVLDEQRQWLNERIADDPGLCEATRVDRVLGRAEDLVFKDLSLRVIHAPGHTAGHLLLHEPTSGTLITGDTVMGDAVPSTANYYVGDQPDPADAAERRPRFTGLPSYLDTIRSLRPLEVRTILPAHGGVIDRPKRAIEDAVLFYEVRVQRIERGLRTLAAMGQDVTGWEIWKALFPKADPVREMRNRMLMVIGALDVLERSGRCITERREDGLLRHHHS